MREVFKFLYPVSVGVWVTSLFITACYNNSIPMWVSLVAMNAFNILKDVEFKR